VSDQTAGEVLLPVRETALRLGVSVSTVSRMIDDQTLQCVRQRRHRKTIAAQVAYILAAIAAGRSGSIEGFAAEWLAKRPQQAAAPEAVAS
jgi:excisionase family DNA binding protein